MRLLLILLSFSPLLLSAQNFKVTGKVLDSESEEALQFATVSLLNANDNSLVTGAVTQADGSFSIPAEEGSYTVRVQFVTYQLKQIPNIKLNTDNPTVNLGEISIAPADQELDEVVVQAERTQMQLNLDKKVYNVGKDLSNLGGSASDMLDNLPSVTVDVEGNVELRGSTNVKILINGRPSGLVGMSSTDALQQLQSNLIESVEIITNPSARYDAEGQAGIINIILKKDQEKGLNGSFQLSTGYPHNHGVGINTNFRRKWVNFFVNYGFDYNQAPGRNYSNQQFFDDDTLTSYTDQVSERLRGGFSHNVRFGADFNVGENSMLTASFLYRRSNSDNYQDLEFFDYDANRNLQEFTLRDELEEELDKNLEYSLIYERNFKKKDHKFTANVQYQDNYENEISSIDQTSGVNSDNIEDYLYQNVDNVQGEERLMLQADYIQPFGENAKFELGYRSTFRNVYNDYLVEESPDGNVYTPLDTFTFDFLYKEYVHGFYGIVSDQMEKISWQVGLRSEVSDIETSISGNENKAFYDYVNFFPSAFFTYQMKEFSQVQLSYSRRINRPRYRDLSPLSSFSNNRNFRVGNPTLQPEYTDSYELGYLQNFKNSSIYYGLYYRHTNDPIQRVNRRVESNTTVSIEENLGVQRSLGFEINANQDFTDWYRLSGNFNFFRQETSGFAYGEDLNAETVTFTTRVSNNINLKDLFMAQINVNYRAPQKRPQGERKAVTVLDIGLSKDIWSKKGTVSLSVRDVFNSRKFRNITQTSDYYAESEFQWRRGPQFVLTLNYRLNQQFKKEGQRRGDREDPGAGIREGFDGSGNEGGGGDNDF